MVSGIKKTGAGFNLYHFGILLIACIAGMNLFIYLKLLGFGELSFLSDTMRNALLPLATVMGLITATNIGLLELKLFNQWRRFSFLKFVLYKYALIGITIVLCSVVIYIVFAFFIQHNPMPVVWSYIPYFLRSGFFLSLFLFLLFFSIAFNVLKTVSAYLGNQAVAGVLLGKYHQPAEEDLAFIFIDLKSSTTIAEKLGHARYSLLIEKCFALLTACIYEFNASVYQFVGDEAVLLWKTKIARQNLAPVHLYYAFLQKIRSENAYFLHEFGEVPHFRAAIHAGIVAVTEIRSTKTDVVYHGDVLNTCARIKEQCSRLDKDLLASAEITGWMLSSVDYCTTLTDTITFRGKNGETAVYEINPYLPTK